MSEVALLTTRAATWRTTAREVPCAERAAFLPRRFDRHHTTVALFLRSYAAELCPDYQGGPWRFFETSSCTCFAVPADQESLLVSVEANGFEARVSAEVAGLIVSLYTLARLAQVTRSAEHMRLSVLLRNYAMEHPKAVTIFRAID